MYKQAKQEYAAYGVDTEKAIDAVASIPVSVHCWQGDDVIGLDGGGSLSGGIQTTGNYPGRAFTVPPSSMTDASGFCASCAATNICPSISRRGWSLPSRSARTALTLIRRRSVTKTSRMA